MPEAITDTGTGRLVGGVGERTRRVVYGEPSAAELVAELGWMTRVDRAHLVMLAERGLVTPGAAAALLRTIARLAGEDYAPLLDRPAPRGVYLMYENYLIERLGADVGGVLHTGRSRNDLKATITALRLRDWLLDFLGEAVRLLGVLLARARAYRAVPMPVYTHFQAAMPITYGYYLLGVALAVEREIAALRSAAAGLDAGPLGAGAVAGTDLPIDPGRTAELLGFAAPAPHALDAVASRDVALRVLAGATGLAVTLSRLAADLQLWSTVEFGFVRFPDRLVGGSSAMPQKRNAFLLEHLRAKPGAALGALAAAASTMATTPFTNSIEVGTEAMASVWPGLAAVADGVALGQVLVSGARPVPDRMLARVADGFTTATFLANQMIRTGVPFRTAHRSVGTAVRAAVDAGVTELAGVGDVPGIDEVVRAQAHGGGPGAFDAAFDGTLGPWADHRAWLRDRRLALADADAALADAVRAYVGAAAEVGNGVPGDATSGDGR